MPTMPTEVFSQLLLPFMLRVFFIGGIFCLAVGLGLIISGARTLRLFEVMNRWVSFRKSTKPMSVSRDAWPLLQRYRIPFALVIVIAAAFSAYNLITRNDTLAVAIMVGAKFHVPSAFVVWIASSVHWFLVAGCVAGIAVGVLLAFFPDALMRIEKWTSRSYSSRELSKQADVMHYTLDKWVANNPRITGWIIVVVALIEVIDVATLLFAPTEIR